MTWSYTLNFFSSRAWSTAIDDVTNYTKYTKHKGHAWNIQYQSDPCFTLKFDLQI